MAFTLRSREFLTDNNSAESRGDDCIAIKLAKFVGQPSTDFCCDVGVLKKQCTLEIFAAMQPGTQNEVAIEQRTSLAEKREEIFAHEAVDLSMEGGGPRRLCPGLAGARPSHSQFYPEVS